MRGSSTQLALAFGAMLLAGLLLTSGLRKRSFSEVLAGITQGHPEASGVELAAMRSAGGGGALAPAPSAVGASVHGGGGFPEGTYTGHKRGLLEAAMHNIARGYGWSEGEIADWGWIITNESGWNPQAANSSTGAYGLGQLNPENAANPAAPRAGSTAAQYPGYHSSDPVTQLEVMAHYIHNRYGSPRAARAYHEVHGAY